MKILIIFGTRPEAIKMAPVLREFEKNNYFQIKSCVTGQHKEMLTQVLDFFKIKPDFDLDIMTKNQNLSTLTSKLIIAINSVIEEFKPELVMVQGDTTTALSGAMAAFYNKVPVAHIEAGLRSNDKYAPFPEEVNRKLIANIADYHFCPTKGSKSNLNREGINKNVHVVGNTVIDALNLTINIVNENIVYYRDQFSYLSSEKKFILVTGHRRENFGDGFERICEALILIAEKYPHVNIVYPVHLNPNIQDTVRRVLGGHINIFLLDPVDYPSMVYLISRSYLVLTDSGGIQEEAPSLGKPVLVLRDVTERMEGVQAGTALLVGADTQSIVNEVSKLIDDPEKYRDMSTKSNPYGDGFSSSRILENFL
jgi:UDP-N-acetylglucosamine 2-epimerase (non-hydrolysing)